MQEDRNEQLVQQRERKMRATNIIIHDADEPVNIANDTENKTKDQLYVDELFKTIGVNSVSVAVTRLGKLDENKARPLKVKLANESEQQLVMSRLSNLKNSEDRFRKISITNDYTVKERDEIRKWVTKAKEKNNTAEANVIWRVNGTPKNGLRLVIVHELEA